MIRIRDLINQNVWVRVAYRGAKQSYYDWRERSFLRIPLADCYHFKCECRLPLLLITVAYNRADMIRHQLRLMPKYLTDPFHHIVIDNSSNSQVRKEIELACRERATGYVSLPKNFYTQSSSSHGMALNWAYQHLVQRFSPRYVGFLDHDIFPIRKHSIIRQLISQPAYGKRDTEEKISYLWPGFSFYCTKLLADHQVDFKPGVIENIIVDTGGLMPIQPGVSAHTWTFAEEHFKNITREDTASTHRVEWMKVDDQDTWLHYIAAGHGAFSEHKKEAICKLLVSY